jgi:ribosomal protein S18 acetylase RimI-like enzyme
MRIQRVVSAGQAADQAEFGGLVRIYTEALPASERKSVDALRQMIERPEYLFLAAVDEDAVVGFLIAIALVDCDAALLEYMAVDRERRGMRIGSQLFRAAVARTELRNRYLLGEVERESADGADARNRARRKRFYRQFGTRQIEGLTYLMPKVSSAEPPLMDMLVYRNEFPGAIDKARLRGWLGACYSQVYGVPEEDARIGAMLSGLPQTIRLI